MLTQPLDPSRYYRMPWSLADNAITWLEPTTKCNIYCDGCYRANDPDGHRPLADVIQDINSARKLRNTGGISIAGGEPLIYPEIIPLVRYIASRGIKPIIITNGTALTPELIRKFLDAGLVAFTVHIDSHQGRPDWTGKNEIELNQLRTHIAQMIREAGKGKITCAFNATIYPDTVDYIPALTRWAQENIHQVQSMVFILYREASLDPKFDHFVGARKIERTDADRLQYNVEFAAATDALMVENAVARIREACPDYEPGAYLNSNQDSSSIKWLLASRVGNPRAILGYMDAKFYELVQTLHHLVFGTYLAYARPAASNNVHALFPMAFFSKGMRGVLKRWLASRRDWLRRLYLQTILVLQPPDILPDGRHAMCDGCPDAIYHQGRMLWKCRLDEIQKFGDFIQSYPKAETIENEKAGTDTGDERLEAVAAESKTGDFAN